MLTSEDIKQLNEFFKLTIATNTVQKISGGDVNETYLIESENKKFIVKTIHDDAYTKDYNVTLNELISSITFSEHIAQQFLGTENASSALFVKQNCVLKTPSGLFTVYPFSPGSIKENDAISLVMTQKIAEFLSLLHQTEPSFNYSFANKKIKIFKNIGQEIINLSLWSRIKQCSHKAFLFPKLNQIATHLLTSKATFLDSINQLEGTIICHNDLKPKNVLWEDERRFKIIDWETTGLFDPSADYLDTLLAWCTHYNGKEITLNQEKLQTFVSAYPLASHAELHKNLPIIFIKWYFWLAFCSKKMLENPKQWRHYYWHLCYSVNFIIFLINHEFFKKL
jgi:thiamine kinase-like enzyme